MQLIKNNIKLWSFILIPLLAFIMTGYWWLYSNQGRAYFKYKDIGEEHEGIGRIWLDVGILDGFRLKKATSGPVEDWVNSINVGLVKGTPLVYRYDLDNDGQKDILVAATDSVGNRVNYLFRIGKKKLEKIDFIDYHTGIIVGNSLDGDRITFGPKDIQGRYTFIEESLVRRTTTAGEIYRSYYRFNENNEIVLERKETEYTDLLALW
ncbi:MAG: hypothetical protein ABIJ91_01580 [Candidatus Kuenenbacteria bacterium]